MKRDDDSNNSLPDRLSNAFRTLGVTGRIVLAVSGGADSMALLRAACRLADRDGLTFAVAHLDHALRPESADEARCVAAFATEQSLDVFVERIDVHSVAHQTSRGIEETARRLRYEFLTQAAIQFEAAFVATAHTADDLAETVLFHALRGTGLRGLRGIPVRRRLTESVVLVRPLLGVSRSDVERYLAAIGQTYLTDPSNADPAFTRNLLRREILPRLRETVNPRLDEALLRLAQQATEASSLVIRLARNELRHALVESTPTQIRLRTRRLASRPRAVVRETVALAWRRAGWPRQRMSFAHWNAIAAIVVHGGRRSLPGRTDVRRSRGELILRRPPH
ncbi:MAG: tRNA lysidine(34) synthetase TilS [Planctomycetaceae bacterium]